MIEIPTASVILALLFSLTATAQNTRETNKAEPLPRDLEIQLALSALPPHLRDDSNFQELVARHLHELREQGARVTVERFLSRQTAAAEGKRGSRSVRLRSTWATPGVSGKSPTRAAASPHAPDTARGAASRSAVWLLRRLVGCTSLITHEPQRDLAALCRPFQQLAGHRAQAHLIGPVLIFDDEAERISSLLPRTKGANRFHRFLQALLKIRSSADGARCRRSRPAQNHA